MRVREDLVVVAREAQASAAAKAFRARAPAAFAPDDLVLAFAKDRSVTLPGAADVEEIRLNVEMRSDGGAHVRMAARCADASQASAVATTLTDGIARENTPAVRMMTHGLLNDAHATATGDTVSLELALEDRHLATFVELLAAVP
jgi:hypothetical protein